MFLNSKGWSAEGLVSGLGPYTLAVKQGALRASGLSVPVRPPVSVIVAGWPLSELEDLCGGFESFAPTGSRVR